MYLKFSPGGQFPMSLPACRPIAKGDANVSISHPITNSDLSITPRRKALLPKFLRRGHILNIARTRRERFLE